MNWSQWQQLTEDRLADTAALLTAGRWTAAYYLAGYSVECALKSCVLHHMEKTGIFFRDRQYLKELSACWTHDLDKLLYLSGLSVEFGVARGTNAALQIHWGIVKDWSETSRYDVKTEVNARTLHQAITHEPDGVLRWLRSRW